MGICNLFYIFELLINETKASYIHPNLGRLAKVCFGYIQVSGNAPAETKK